MTTGAACCTGKVTRLLLLQIIEGVIGEDFPNVSVQCIGLSIISGTHTEAALGSAVTIKQLD